MIVLDLDRLSLIEQAEAYEREADYLASTIRMFGRAGRRHALASLRCMHTSRPSSIGAKAMTTTDYVKEFLRRPHNYVRDCLQTADGSRISMQASAGHYCSPREDDAPHYTSVELFNWSTKRCPMAFRPYQSRSNYVAAFVPVEAVNCWIRRHGGLAALEPKP